MGPLVDRISRTMPQRDIRDEVGQVGDRLHNLLEVNILDLVQQQGEDQRRGKLMIRYLKFNSSVFLNARPEVLIPHELVEVLQAAPFIAEDAAAGAVAAERNDVAEHRDVAEHDVVHNGNEHHCVPLPVLFKVLHRGTLLLDSGHRSVFCAVLGMVQSLLPNINHRSRACVADWGDGQLCGGLDPSALRCGHQAGEHRHKSL